MDWSIRPRADTCAGSGRKFADGETVFTVLVAGEGGVERAMGEGRGGGLGVCWCLLAKAQGPALHQSLPTAGSSGEPYTASTSASMLQPMSLATRGGPEKVPFTAAVRWGLEEVASTM